MPSEPIDCPIPAIRYSPRAVMAARPLIVGLTVATQTFFDAYVRANPGQPIVGYVRDEASVDDMRAHVAELGGDPAQVGFVTPDNRDELARAGAVLMLDPALEREARARRDPRGYSLIGLTHSLSSRESWREISRYTAAPLQPWDAIVCTSRVARDVIDTLLDAADESMAQVGIRTPRPRPSRPIIPLGIDGAGLAACPVRRADWRARHGIAADAVVVLFFGRLSMHAKAHPFAMFRAVEEAARRLSVPLHFVLAGQFATPPIREAFHGLAAERAGLFRTTIIESPDNEERRAALSGADIFLSLADSVQETFGLAPVEAMAAGLPVVVTDWDGYRDTIRHGVEGFRVPTVMAPSPAGALALRQYLDNTIEYDRFCAVMGQMVAVDIRVAADAIHTLASDPARRRLMGAAGVARVRAIFDWPAVMGQWRRLWTGLARLRAEAPMVRRPRPPSPPADTAAPSAPPPGVPPATIPEPMALFRTFPTRLLNRHDRLHLTAPDAPALVERARATGSFRYAFANLPGRERVETVIERIAQTPGISVEGLMLSLPQPHRTEALRTLLFLAKRDLLTISRPPA
ncbi:glycosyl transferase family 1 [Stella humosa]|uniref:Glycosyl transferase family 1 n=1 Tax=Stella humosa TaxID=94 RepID=A0A3N1MAW3_9PROT|nr:glycosyltransferase family 4 protein [Stella humosa]ROQ00195.1 glycosyl transferase family 1 [Stella humosa]BBK30570.1 hypothetical protein STHU_12040 [Stella humosa]